MRLRYRTAIENGVCAVILTAAPLLVMLPGMLRGDVPVDASSALAYAPWEEARPAGMAVDPNPGANVEAQRYYPWYVFLSRIDHVKDVLWNPLEYGGQPFFAAWRTRCLSPFSLPFYFGDAPDALRLSVLLKLWVAGFLAFYAARRIGLRPSLAMVPAAAFQFSGPLLVWTVLPISDVLPWLPMLFVFVERLALGHYRAWPGGALVLAAMLLAGEPEACTVLAAFALAYFALRIVGEWRGVIGSGVSVVSIGAALALAIGVAGVQLLPFAEFHHYAAATAAPEVRYAPERFEFAAWVLPYVSVNAGELAPGATIASHSGLVLLLLLPIWFALRPFAEPRTRRRCEALLAPLIAFNVLAHFWMGLRDTVPFAHTINPEHLLAANGFALGMIGALTADEWLRLGSDEIKSTVKRIFAIAPLCVAAAITAVVWPGGHAGLVPGPWWSAVLAAVFVAAAIVLLGYNVVQPSIRVLGYALAAIVAIDLAIAFVPHMPSTPRALLYPETPFVALLKKTGGRVTGSAAIADWPLAANAVPQLYGAGGIAIKHQHDYRKRTEDDPLLLRRSGSQLLLLKQEDIQGRFAPLREVLRIEQVLPTGAILFYDSQAKGRAWMAYEARNVEKYSPEEVRSTEPILLEQGVPPPPLPPDKAPGSATIAPNETNTKITVTLDGVSKGILVLADAYFPGWEAKVDGNPAHVIAVDALFRGVEVNEGATEIVFEYDPPLIKAGLAITAASLAAVAIGCILLLPSTLRAARERKGWSL